MLEDLLECGWAANRITSTALCDVTSLDLLARTAKTVNLDRLRPNLAEAVRLLRRAGLLLTDRRIVRAQSLIAAATVLDGRTEATGADLWPLIFAIPTREGQELGREVLGSLLEEARNAALPAAAQDASAGLAARAGRIVRDGEMLLACLPEATQKPASWLLKLEALAREIEAGFSEQSMPQSLFDLRATLKSELEGDHEQNTDPLDA